MMNPEEDELMSQAAYQKKQATGIADGIERFLKAVDRKVSPLVFVKPCYVN